MIHIYKLRDDPVLDFAAGELKKYLRMMQPEENLISIALDPKAQSGYRLGLLEDFGLPNEAVDPVFDDVVHVDTVEDGGVLAGSNPRSVLFAVYRFLRLNGCRFLFPGIEGERIPVKKPTPQSYHKLADHRIRGRTIEGRPSVEEVAASLDFYAKEEINAFGCYGVSIYHNWGYAHEQNKANREPEFVDLDLADSQWRGLYETEAQKRGMMIISGEHEMIPCALGLKVSDRFLYKQEKKELPPEVIPYLAQIKGERKLFAKDIFATNVCMSRADIRERMAQAVVHEIESRPHLQIFGCTVADGRNNHCECPECQKKIPSDWLVMILNRIDQLLTEKKIDTKVQLAFYVDMIFAPETEKFVNPDRFILQYCPISRTYTKTLQEGAEYPEPIKYVRNNWEAPSSQEMLMALFEKWKKVLPATYYVFEYHYWIHQYRDPGMMAMARRVYEDVRSYRYTDMAGCMQDGSNKSFWPNGFMLHIYNEAMINRDCDYEEELQDFFANLYGEKWAVARDYLQAITDAFNHKYMCGEMSVDEKMGVHYCPEQAASLSKVAEITEKFLAFAKTVQLKHRVEYQAWKLLEHHARYCAGLAKVMIVKCQGDTPKAIEMGNEFFADFGKHDIELGRWLDFELIAESLKAIIKKKPKVEL